jgi:chemotaxis protein MotB
MADKQENHNDEPVIISKGKKCGGGHHGGAWKVAYSDFVTAMMALFIVLWVLAQSDEVKTSIAHYFQNPTILGISGSKSFMRGQGPGTGHKDIEGELKTSSEKVKDAERQVLIKKGKAIISLMQGTPDLSNLLDQVDVQITQDGLRIELLDNKGSFFLSGSTTPTGQAKKMLFIIGKQLSELNNKIVVEGHTDARPMPPNSKGYTNFDLSTDRANVARRILENSGVSPEQIDEVRGYAAHRLRDMKHPYSAVNRRISILVKFDQVLE